MKQSRNTTAKATILTALENAHTALSHAELLALVNGVCDRVTVYRVLDRLVKEDKVHKVITLDGTIRYAACYHKEQHSHNHVHFNCEKCNTTTCMETVNPEVQLSSDYTITSYNFTVTGICPKCN
ncbi:Fur family transcriptional regulator [Flavobacterium sp.]|jgi:Fur family ferric uptake transcriptional regulator|uniref:Fur family transcriptional regulator n=1 Tax=Flavobacterium sp. TaxID=239 RepID=UPI00378342B6